MEGTHHVGLGPTCEQLAFILQPNPKSERYPLVSEIKITNAF